MCHLLQVHRLNDIVVQCLPRALALSFTQNHQYLQPTLRLKHKLLGSKQNVRSMNVEFNSSLNNNMRRLWYISGYTLVYFFLFPSIVPVPYQYISQGAGIVLATYQYIYQEAGIVIATYQFIVRGC